MAKATKQATDTKKKRNTYDVDETLDSPFNFSHLKRSMVYVKRYKTQLALAMLFSLIAILCNHAMPYLFMLIVDKFIVEKNVAGMIIVSIILLALAVMFALCTKQRSLMSAKTGQAIVSEIRTDLFRHLQELPFDYYDSRPHGKILVRVVNYVNTVADFFANGLINVILEFLALIIIVIFMFMTSPSLTLIVLVGLIPFGAYIIITKNAQRKWRQAFSNKNSNLNAYYQENINGMKVTQSFTREEKNIEIADKLAGDCRYTHMRLVKVVHCMFPSL